MWLQQQFNVDAVTYPNWLIMIITKHLSPLLNCMTVDIVYGKFHLAIYMIPCYFYDLLDCESLSPTDSGMMHESSSFVQNHAI